ncbi:hypothetical protein BDA99DRAFT_541051 [Phascolomyces articulosus]|uniref:Uncharacterized protein n=1 Tax=Phascolomyces articulosus TaxID=60185 RepID=A0AAD5K255_9FUNG|nr:hypothetical protein BDA99DRAFT_541051 [Phascolomyces articulosus]
MYFPGTLNPDTLRSESDFKNGDATIFVGHDYQQNIKGSLLSRQCSKNYGQKRYLIIQAKMAISAKGSSAVDYIDLLLYVIPTIDIEQLEQANNCTKRATNVLVSLVKACPISLSWELTSNDIIMIKELYADLVPCEHRVFGVWSELKTSQMKKKMVYIDPSAGAPEICGFHLDDTKIDKFENYNLMAYVRHFWGRIRTVQAKSLPPLLNEITVGRRLFFNNTTFDCKLFDSERNGTFLKLGIPVDKNAHRGFVSENRVENKVFFIHLIDDLTDERIICLVDITQDVKLTGYGSPFGKNSYFG